MYHTSLFKRERICNCVKLDESLRKRIKQLMDVVAEFSTRYYISDPIGLVVESIIYSYERQGCPTPLPDDITHEIYTLDAQKRENQTNCRDLLRECL